MKSHGVGSGVVGLALVLIVFAGFGHKQEGIVHEPVVQPPVVAQPRAEVVQDDRRTTAELIAQINRVVTEWHRAAATGDLQAYSSRMTPDVVFLGTDKTERWVGEGFMEFCRPYFRGPVEYGQGAWTYEPIERFVTLSSDGRTGWFDELLVNANYGHCRGTGVAALGNDNQWRIAHYSLTFLVPNEIAKQVVGQIRAHETQQGGQP